MVCLLTPDRIWHLALVLGYESADFVRVAFMAPFVVSVPATDLLFRLAHHLPDSAQIVVVPDLRRGHVLWRSTVRTDSIVCAVDLHPVSVGRSTRKYFGLTGASRALVERATVGSTIRGHLYPPLARDAAAGRIAVQSHVRLLSFRPLLRDGDDPEPRLKTVRGMNKL